MRALFRGADAGITSDALRWGVRTGAWTRIMRGIYGDGPEPPSPLDRERAAVLARGAVARGSLGGVLLGLDSVRLDGRPLRADVVEVGSIVAGVPCATATQVLVDLAAIGDDDIWEQSLESALRKRLTSVDALRARLPALRAARAPGAPRMRRVLSKRPAGVPPTESLLETLALQLSRGVPSLGELARQHEIRSRSGAFVARVDLCHPGLGVFFELDGQQHRDQPVYDAARETAVVAVTGWLPARFTWHQITRTPRVSQRRMAEVAARAAERRSA